MPDKTKPGLGRRVWLEKVSESPLLSLIVSDCLSMFLSLWTPTEAKQPRVSDKVRTTVGRIDVFFSKRPIKAATKTNATRSWWLMNRPAGDVVGIVEVGRLTSGRLEFQSSGEARTRPYCPIEGLKGKQLTTAEQEEGTVRESPW